MGGQRPLWAQKNRLPRVGFLRVSHNRKKSPCGRRWASRTLPRLCFRKPPTGAGLRRPVRCVRFWRRAAGRNGII